MVTDDGAVLLDMRSGSCFGLNPTGAAVWCSLVSGTDIDTVIAELVHRHDTDPARVRADVAQLMRDLDDAGLLAATPDKGSDP
ncbi:MAG: lasso peptide biosynthesis PqqD family chaperone [Pseudonocardia sp.]